MSRISWPSLAAFLAGWLNLSIKAAEVEDEIIYLIYAERMIDANEIDQAWCEINFEDDSVEEVAKRLLAGKENRILQDTWG